MMAKNCSISILVFELLDGAAATLEPDVEVLDHHFGSGPLLQVLLCEGRQRDVGILAAIGGYFRP